MSMRYMKTLEQRMAEVPAGMSLSDKGSNGTKDLGKITGGIECDAFESVIGEEGDFLVNFTNEEGKKTSCVLKDTGNRRDEGTGRVGAYVAVEGTASDGKNYIGVSKMTKVEEGEYELKKFIVYEK